jgi:sRNA-binding protein
MNSRKASRPATDRPVCEPRAAVQAGGLEVRKAILPTLALQGPSARQKRSQAAAAAIALLAEAFPKTFFVYQEHRHPLKLGIDLDILAALASAIPPAELHRALGFYCSNPSYLGRLREGTSRLDLDGKPAGVVTADEEALARARLASIKAKKEARAAAAKVQAPAPAVKRLSLADLKAAAVARKTNINTEFHRRK